MSPFDPQKTFFMDVEVGEGAVHFIANPNADPHLQWVLRYGGGSQESLKSAAMSAATVLSGFDSLLSDRMSMEEATRRLRLLRAAHRAAIIQPKG